MIPLKTQKKSKASQEKIGIEFKIRHTRRASYAYFYFNNNGQKTHIGTIKLRRDEAQRFLDSLKSFDAMTILKKLLK